MQAIFLLGKQTRRPLCSLPTVLSARCALCQGCAHSQPRAVLGVRGGVLRSLCPLPGAVLGGPGVSVLTARAVLTVRGAATLLHQLLTELCSGWMAGGKSAEAEGRRCCHISH